MPLILKTISNETTVKETISYKLIVTSEKKVHVFFLVLLMMLVRIQQYSGEKVVFLLHLIFRGFYFFAVVVFFRFLFFIF